MNKSRVEEKAYQLNAKLNHLTLSGIDEWGELVWIGTREDYDKAELEIFEYENSN